MSKNKALRLREILLKEQFTWDNQAEIFLNAINGLLDEKNILADEEIISLWDRDNAFIDINEYLSMVFLPNMCDLILNCEEGKYSNYVRCVLVRFDENKQIRQSLLIAGQKPPDKGKVRSLEEGIVGIMREQNGIHGFDVSEKKGVPVFHNFTEKKSYVLINDEIKEFKTEHLTGEQDKNLRAILALPIIFKDKMEGAVTLDFYNTSLVNLEDSLEELRRIMRCGMKCIQNLIAIIFLNFNEEMEED